MVVRWEVLRNEPTQADAWRGVVITGREQHHKFMLYTYRFVRVGG